VLASSSRLYPYLLAHIGSNERPACPSSFEARLPCINLDFRVIGLSITSREIPK
jgi:hypothetical protein